RGGDQATASAVRGDKADPKTREITNAPFDANATAVPGRAPGERLLLRKTTKSREVMGDMGVEATVTIDAWPLGTDLTTKPLYSVTLEGLDAVVEDYAVLVFDRGTEEVDWWSVYKLGTGEPLFDSYVPVLHFSVSRESQTMRYVGFDVPPAVASIRKLRQPAPGGVLD